MTEVLRTMPGWRGGATRAVRAVLVVGAAPVLVSVLAAHDLLYNRAGGGAWTLAAVTVWPLVLRRRFPLTVFGVVLTAFLGLLALDGPPFAGFALLVALNGVAAGRRAPVAIGAAAVLAVPIVLVAEQQAPARSVDDTIVLLVAAAAASLLLGTTLRGQRRLLAALADRAERAETARMQEAQIAAAAERTRIAREMHDIVAHGLSVMVALADGAAERAIDRPASAAVAMRQVAGTGREALAEMRTLLRVLRPEETAPLRPQPRLTDLEELVRDVRATGLEIELTVDRALDPLDPMQQIAAFRIVQEALTNVLKHAPGAALVEVRVDQPEEAVVVRIENDGAAMPQGAGNGIGGMRERAALFGGSLVAGPAGRGWVVEARWSA